MSQTKSPLNGDYRSGLPNREWDSNPRYLLLRGMPVYQTGAFNHSATPPHALFKHFRENPSITKFSYVKALIIQMEFPVIPQSFFALTKGNTESCDDRKPFGSETTANCLLRGLLRPQGTHQSGDGGCPLADTVGRTAIDRVWDKPTASLRWNYSKTSAALAMSGCGAPTIPTWRFISIRTV